MGQGGLDQVYLAVVTKVSGRGLSPADSATREPLLSGGGAPRDFDFAAGVLQFCVRRFPGAGFLIYSAPNETEND